MLENKVKINVGGDFTPVPTGIYTAQAVDVNLKEQLKFHSTETEQVLNFQFAILDDLKLPDGSTTRGRFLWKRCRLALNDRSWLGKLAKAIIGRDMTKDEAEKFDPESLINKTVDVMVEQVASKTDPTRMFSNIIVFSPASKKLDLLEYGDKSLAATTSTTSVVSDEAKEDGEEVDDEIAVLELEKKMAALKAKKNKK